VKRVILTLGILVVVVAAAVGYYVFSSLDSLVKDAIETYGSEMTGTAVRVGSVSISLSDGRGSVRGLRVANPEGFASGDAFSLGEITLALDIASLTQEPLVVSEVLIDGPVANVVVSPTGRTNFDAIRKNVERYGGSSGSSKGGAGSDGDAASEAPPPMLRIQKFTFDNGSVQADARAVGGKELTRDLPPLSLRDLGGRSGKPADEIGQIVLEAYTKTIVRSVAAGQAERVIDEKLGGAAGEAAKGLLNKMLD
jgi:hypothetical protein